jgi:alpha/beta superfamily hydrolase
VKTETTLIESIDAKLHAQLYIPDAVPAPALLICHGMNSQGYHFLKIYKNLAETACKEGYLTLLFDFRGVGRSAGAFDYGIKEQQDVKNALNYLASRQEAQSSRIFVVGHSLGGAVSVYALQNERRIKGLALWSVPKNHAYNVQKFITITRGKRALRLFQLLAPLDNLFNVSKLFKLEVYGIRLRLKHVRNKLMKLNECEAVKKLHIPLLIVAGNADTIVGLDEAQEIYQSANEHKTLIIIEDADHIFTEKERELIAKTMDWIKEQTKVS